MVVSFSVQPSNICRLFIHFFSINHNIIVAHVATKFLISSITCNIRRFNVEYNEYLIFLHLSVFHKTQKPYWLRLGWGQYNFCLEEFVNYSHNGRLHGQGFFLDFCQLPVILDILMENIMNIEHFFVHHRVISSFKKTCNDLG